MSVYHLKYRPEKLADLDSVNVRESLTSWLKAKELPGSFLFAGPKGSGKTSAARILSKSINCEKRDGVEACGECGNCKEIEKGNSLDVIELDGASNRGIEDVRAIKDKAYLLPNRLKNKVIIIDEVHMLTKEAFNALLKLIEEPPVHTVFVLCTTDPEKIPETVLSRLVRVDFKKGGKKELIASLQRIVKGEGVKIDKESLELLASKSDGSFRNIARAFNELVVSLGGKIEIEDVEEYFSKRKGDYSFEEMEEDLAEGRLTTILERLEAMAEKGIDFVGYRNDLIEYFQKKLLTAYGVGEEKIILPVDKIAVFINQLIVVGRMEKEVEIEQLPLQMAVVEFMGKDYVKSEGGGGEKKKEKVKKEKVKKETKVVLESKEKEEVVKEDEKIYKMDFNFGISEVEEKWGEVLLAVKPFNHSIEAFLRASRPTKLESGTLVIEVYYPFHKDKLEDPRNRKIVEKGLEKVMGVKLAFECKLSKSKKESLVIDNSYGTKDGGADKPLEEEDKIYDVAKEIFG